MLSCDVIGIDDETCVDKTAVSEESKLWKKHIEDNKKYSIYFFLLIITKKVILQGL
jgi:hypothetical protein